MFFIAGITQKEITESDSGEYCPKCGSMSLIKKRIDTYFSFFFIPLFPVKKGKSFMACRTCSRENGQPFVTPAEIKCPNCRVKIPAEYPYCPYCRTKL